MDLGPTLHKKGTVNKNRIHLSVLPGCGQDPYSSFCPSWLWMESLFIPLSFLAVGRAHINPSVLPGCGQHPYPSLCASWLWEHPYPSLCAAWLWIRPILIALSFLAVDRADIHLSVLLGCEWSLYSSLCRSWLWTASVSIPCPPWLWMGSIVIPLSFLEEDRISIHSFVLPAYGQDALSHLKLLQPWILKHDRLRPLTVSQDNTPLP